MSAVIDLAALPPSFAVPGIARWLGRTPPEPDDSVESYEAYLERISARIRPVNTVNEGDAS